MILNYYINDQPISIALAVPVSQAFLNASHTRTLVDLAEPSHITGGLYYPFGFNERGWVYSGPTPDSGIAPSPWDFELSKNGWGWLINVDGINTYPGYTPIGTVVGGKDLLAEILNSSKVEAFDLHKIPLGPNGFYEETGASVSTSAASDLVPEPKTLWIVSAAMCGLLFKKGKSHG